jgi:lipase chaperone LimK
MHLNTINKKTRLAVIMFVVILLVVFKPFKESTKQQLNKVESNKSLQQPSGATEASNRTQPSINNNPVQSQQEIRSYAGSKPDGKISINARGTIITDIDLKRLFDYFLTATGELSLDEITLQLSQYATGQLNGEQLQQLLGLFDRYQSYLTDAQQLSTLTGDDISLQEKMWMLSALRTDALGEEMAQAFFADEENYINFTLNDKQIDDELSEQEIQWLAAENRATEFQDTLLQNQQFQQQALTKNDIQAIRTEQYGRDAANRLAELDTQRAQWQAVVDGYFEQRQLIESAQVSTTLQQLHENYSNLESKRLNSLWNIEQH